MSKNEGYSVYLLKRKIHIPIKTAPVIDLPKIRDLSAMASTCMIGLARFWVLP